MTKIDERSVVPPVGESERTRLAAVLDRPGVVAAWLFGSQARGRVGPLADIDIAVWLDPALAPRERFEQGLELSAEVARTLGTDEIDLVVLNDSPPLFQHRAMSVRAMLVEREHDDRVRLETRALLEYLDTAPLRRLADEAVRRRLEEGRFGRP